jgi:hypothetical protein
MREIIKASGLCCNCDDTCRTEKKLPRGAERKERFGVYPQNKSNENKRILKSWFVIDLNQRTTLVTKIIRISVKYFIHFCSILFSYRT